MLYKRPALLLVAWASYPPSSRVGFVARKIQSKKGRNKEMTTRTEPLKVLVLTLALALAASLLVLVGPLTNKALSLTTPSGTIDANTLPPSDPTNVCDEASFGGNHGELGTWGQTFTALHSGNVHSVQLSVRGFDQTVTEPWTPPMDDISVRLTTVDASGKPDTNTILATTTVPASVLGQHHSLVSASFTNPPTIEAGRQYALVLSGQNENNRSGYSWEIQCPRGQYSGGMLMVNIPADGGFIPDAR